MKKAFLFIAFLAIRVVFGTKELVTKMMDKMVEDMEALDERGKNPAY